MKRVDEILLILMEECAEVAQAASKCIRFGTEDNKKELNKELGDLMCMYQLLTEDGWVDPAQVAMRVPEKEAKLKIYSNIFE